MVGQCGVFTHADVSMITCRVDIYRSRPIGVSLLMGIIEVGVVDTRLAAATMSGTAACLHCTQGPAGHGDGYQCGLAWERSSTSKSNNNSNQRQYSLIHKRVHIK